MAKAVSHGPAISPLNGQCLAWRWNRFEGYRCLTFNESGASLPLQSRHFPVGSQPVLLNPVSVSAVEIPELTFGRQLIAALPIPGNLTSDRGWVTYVMHDVLRMEVVFVFTIEAAATVLTLTRIHVAEAQFGEMK
jgi:hypothetical protein